MPLNKEFLRPQNWSRLKPITKALLPPSRHNFGAFFRENIRALKNIFRANFVLQTSHPNVILSS